MNTRRKFLLHGSMATTALLIADPFKSLANALNPVLGYNIHNNTLVLVHTGNLNDGAEHQAIQQVNSLKNKTGNLLHVHTGDQQTAMKPDVSLHTEPGNGLNQPDFQIIYKGGIKTGIIKAMAGEHDTLERINRLAAMLKKEKNCQVVICLSQLGYKNRSAIDDRKLALGSANLDIIISGHPVNCPSQPFISHNSQQEEVIIHATAGRDTAFSNIEIGFDNQLNKHVVSFNNLTMSMAG